MPQEFKLAIVGATGLVGRTILAILEQRNFPVKTVYVLASERSIGSSLSFKGESLLLENLAEFDFHKVDLVFFSAGSTISLEYVPKAVAAGCLVIDNTASFRYEEQVPLVIPEVNAEALKHYPCSGIIANPNCSTIQLLLVVKPIHTAVGVTRINVSTYQSVSGAGRKAVQELIEQTGRLINGLAVEAKAFSSQIAFNVIPHIDHFQENGYTREEMKMLWETRKILNDDRIVVNATAVRVPVLYGHSESVHLETKRKISVTKVKQLLKKAPGLVVLDRRATRGYPMPVTHSAHHDEVFVGRIREDISHPQGLNFWIVADNIRKGAALNAVQIAELMIRDHF